MSATLTWKYNGPSGALTGSTLATFMTDLKALVDSVSANPDYSWEVCSSSLVSTPFYVTLRRKDLSAGRVLVVGWGSAPAGNNAAILQTAPTANQVYMCYFPNGNVSTPSNLTASSGTIMGDDTGALMVVPCGAVASLAATNFRISTIETTESWGFLTQSTSGATTVYGGLAGNIIVDGTDTAFPAVLGGSTTGLGNIPAFSSNTLVWSASSAAAGSVAPGQLRTNEGGTNRSLFMAYIPSNAWNAQTFGSSTDATVDAGAGRLFLMAMPLMGNSGRKDGTSLKLRQMAFGPSAASPWPVINVSGPTKVATGMWPSAPSAPAATTWLTDFKI